MRRFIPHRHELILFAVLAVVFAGIVSLIGPHASDLGMAGFACPMFLVAAVLGLRRSPGWTASTPDDHDRDKA